MARTRPTIFISSTAIDLPDHRKAAIDALERIGFEPIAMERFPPDPADAVTVCLRHVDEADAYLGVYAHRYGWVPPGESRSITEMEYDRAIQRDIPSTSTSSTKSIHGRRSKSTRAPSSRSWTLSELESEQRIPSASFARPRVLKRTSSSSGILRRRGRPPASTDRARSGLGPE